MTLRRNFGLPFIIAFVMIFMPWSASLRAAQPSAPMLCADDSSCLGAPSESYDLYSSDQPNRGPIPFSVNWPDPPTVSAGEVSVYSYDELRQAIRTPNQKINVFGDCRGSLGSPANDLWIELQPGAQIGQNGGVGLDAGSGGVQRLRISCAETRNCVFHGGLVLSSYTSDVLINGVQFSETSTSSTARNNFYDVQRVAVLNTHLTGNNYALGMWRGNAGLGNSDIILANVRVVARNVPAGGNGAIRIQHADRLIIVDSLGDTATNSTGYETLRIEENSRNVWVRNFRGVGGGLRISPDVAGGNASYQIHNVWVHDADFFHNSYLGVNFNNQSDRVFNLTMSDVVFHTDASGSPGAPAVSSSRSDWSITRVVYDSYSVPPLWTFR